jgi:hypothetical protein
VEILQVNEDQDIAESGWMKKTNTSMLILSWFAVNAKNAA